MSRKSAQELQALKDERDAWVDVIREQIVSTARRLVCLAAINRWYNNELRKENES